jgi:hypothetical protein
MAVPILNPEKEYEIIAGQPEEKDMGGARHGGIGARLLIRMGSYVEAQRLGGVYGPDTSFQVGPNERLPDVAFVAAEGTAAALYYRVFRTFLQTDLGFQSRQAHPPTDPVNALLSLGYTLLYNQMLAAIHIVSLDPYQGFFHQRKHGHAALASDLIEEWRAIVVDSTVQHHARHYRLESTWVRA